MLMLLLPGWVAYEVIVGCVIRHADGFINSRPAFVRAPLASAGVDSQPEGRGAAPDPVREQEADRLARHLQPPQLGGVLLGRKRLPACRVSGSLDDGWGHGGGGCGGGSSSCSGDWPW